jgi:hypothetical protein
VICEKGANGNFLGKRNRKRQFVELSWGRGGGGDGRVRIINLVPQQIFRETWRWNNKNNTVGSKADT